MATPTADDALIRAPNHHRLMFENEHVRVLDTSIQPGDTTPLHSHCWSAALYVLSWSDFIRRDEHSTVMLDTRETPLDILPGRAVWSGPLGPHTLENVGDQPIHIISVEVKD